MAHGEEGDQEELAMVCHLTLCHSRDERVSLSSSTMPSVGDVSFSTVCARIRHTGKGRDELEELDVVFLVTQSTRPCSWWSVQLRAPQYLP